jgi:hypothetical protein
MTKIWTALVRGVSVVALATTVLAGLTMIVTSAEASARSSQSSQLRENSSHWHKFCVEHPRSCWPRG